MHELTLKCTQLLSRCINLPRHCSNLFLWLAGLERWALPLRHTEPPPNVPRIMDVLMRVMAYQVNAVLSFSLSPSIYPTMNIMPSCSHLSHQILVERFFQGDISGGNIMLLKDGRLGLLGIQCANLGLICIPYANLIFALLQIWETCVPSLKMMQKTGAAYIC